MTASRTQSVRNLKATIATRGIALVAVVLFGMAATQAQSTSAGEPELRLGPSSIPPSGEVTRYVLPYYYSVTAGVGDRSVAILNVYNQAAVSCDVTVEFQYQSQTTDICTITATIPAKRGDTFCSRPVSDPVAPCHVVCGNGGLTFNEGHAFVDSTNSSACANIAIDAQEVFLRDPADTLVDSMSRLSIVKINSHNNGD